MIVRFLLLISLALLLNSIASFAVTGPKIIVTDTDKVILLEKFNKFSKDKNLSTCDLMLKIGLDFRGTPYVAKTLDKDFDESLVVNLRELDCTTFVENVLSIALAIKGGKPTYETFCTQLEKIRYRNGHLNGYTSRLHYFSEWITDNAAKGIVTDVTHKIGGLNHPLAINFMGTHPNLYPQLNGNTPFIGKIRQVEKEISDRPFYFIPKEMVPKIESELMDGDIVAMTTRIAGLDVSHLGFIYKNGRQTFLLNASSVDMMVEVTHKTLAEYLNGSKSVTGIFVIRAM